MEIEKRTVRNEELRKEEVMAEGKIRLFFQQGSGPDDVFDFGEHQGRTCRGVCLKGPSYCEWALRHQQCGNRSVSSSS